MPSGHDELPMKKKQVNQDTKNWGWDSKLKIRHISE